MLGQSDSEENLRAALGGLHLGGRVVDDVLEKVRSRHYQVNIATMQQTLMTPKMLYD